MSEVKRWTYAGLVDDCVGPPCGPDIWFVLSTDYDALRSQLERAKEWMRHDNNCKSRSIVHDDLPCDCGLTAFLESL
jgi:hypothetical protein